MDKITPSLTAIIVVYFTYRYGLKSKNFSDKKEDYKKVRVIISNVLIIWKEFTKIEKFLKDEDPSNEIVYKIPELTKKYLDIDKEKVDSFKNLYKDSLDNLKEIDVVLFYKLETSLEIFSRTIDEFLFPLIKDKEISSKDKTEILVPMLDELLPELETVIEETSSHLPRKESERVKQIITEHINSLKEKQEDDVPLFFLNLLNNNLPLKEKITSEELLKLKSNETFSWLVTKFVTPKIVEMFLKGNAYSTLKNYIDFLKGDIEQMEKNFPVDEVFGQIGFTDEEDKNFQNNKPFYSLAMGLVIKFKGYLTFEDKRMFVKLNNGNLSVKKGLDDWKKNILK